MKIIRWFLGLVITLVILLIVAVIVIPKVVDPNDYREQISQLVKDKTQRDLTIEGDLKLSVFPWLGVTTGKLSLSQPNHLSSDFGGGNMLEVDASNIRLKILPLLKSITKETKDIQVDTIILKQPNIEIITTASGLTSLDGLSGEEQAAEEDEQAAATAGAALIVQGVDIESGKLVWDDRQAGQRYELRELTVQTGNLLGTKLASLALSGEVLDSSTPDILQFDLTGKASIDVNTLGAKATDLNLILERGDLKTNSKIASVDFVKDAQILIKTLASNVVMDNEEIGPLTVDLSIPEVLFDQPSEVLKLKNISTQGEFQNRPIVITGQDLDVNLAKQTASLVSLLATVDGVSANIANLKASSFIDDPKVTASLSVPEFNAQRLIKSFDVEFDPEKKTALTRVAFNSNLSGSLNAVELKNVKLALDETTLKGFINIANFDDPRMRFDLDIDQINLDEYTPKEDESAAEEATNDPNALLVPLAIFEKFKANGKLDINKLVANGLNINNINVAVVSDATSTTIKPSAKLYDGSFGGSVRYEKKENGASLTVKNQLKSVNLAGLLTDADVTEQLSGIGNLDIDVVVEEINGKQTNRGKVTLGALNGAVKGVDIQKMLRSVSNTYNSLKGKELEDSSNESDETRFASMGGTFDLDNFVINNLDFSMMAPLFRISGQGEIDVKKQELDYTVRVSVVDSFSGQGGQGLSELRGITLPVRFTGPLTSPKYRVDIQSLAKARVKREIEERKEALVKEKLGIEGGGKLSTKNILRGALNKKLEEKYGDPKQDNATSEAAQNNSTESSNQNTAPESNEQPKSKEEVKEDAKDALKRQLLERLLGG